RSSHACSLLSSPWDAPPIVVLLATPPRSTLFPYTTLFRSWVFAVGEVELLREPRQERFWKDVRRGEPGGDRGLEGGGDRKRLSGDRKSTRLNSCHEWISYAVFCLKKKSEKDKIVRPHDCIQ